MSLITLPALFLFWLLCGALAFALYSSGDTKGVALHRKAALLVVALGVLTPTWDALVGATYMAAVCKTQAHATIHEKAEGVEGFILKGYGVSYASDFVYEGDDSRTAGYSYVEVEESRGRGSPKVRVYWSPELQKVQIEPIATYQAKYIVTRTISQNWTQKILMIKRHVFSVGTVDTQKDLAEFVSFSWRGGWFRNVSVDPAAMPARICPSGPHTFHESALLRTNILIPKSLN